MVIEIVPKPAEKKLAWPSIVLIGLAALLIIMLISSLVLNSSQKKMSLEIQDLEERLQGTPEEKSLEAKIKGYVKKINDFNALLSAHQYATNIFSFFERTTHPDVRFTDFSLDSSKRTVKLSGLSRSFIALEQQMGLFKKEKMVLGLNLSNLAISEKGGIEFSLDISFKEDIFKTETR